MNTLAASSNTNRLDSYVEAIIISSITKEIMINNDLTTLYLSYGSVISRVGNYVVLQNI